MRRGIDIAQAESATKIRGKYLRALEEEQFELLPAQTYVRGFLRTYAELLGLDGQLYVDEYNSRFVSGDDHEPRARRTASRQGRDRRTERNIVIGALAVIAILTVIVISAWQTTGGGAKHAATTKTTTDAKPHVTPPLLSLTAVNGSTHVAVRVGSASGTVAYDGTIQQGDAPVGIRGRRFWVQIDTPEALRIEVRGTLVHVPGSKPRVIIVTSTGWRPA